MLTRRALVGAVLAWGAVLPFAFANGWLRQRVLFDALGETAGRAASGAILCAVVVAIACIAMPWLGTLPQRAYWRIGALWLALTFLFETAGNAAAGQTLAEWLRTWTFAGGNLFPLVLATTLVAPPLAARVRGLAV